MSVPAPGPRRAQPPGWWYLVTIGIAVGALFIAVGLAVNGFHSSRSTLENATRVELGTEGTVTFNSPTSQTLYYGGNVQVSSAADVPAFARRVGVRLRADPGGTLVTIHPYTGFGVEESAPGGEQVVALGTFHIDQPGDYVLSSNPIHGAGVDAIIAVTGSPVRPFRHWVALAGATLAVGVALSVIATVGVARARGRSLRGSGAVGMAPGGVIGSGGGAGPWPVSPGPRLPPGWRGPPPIVPPPPPGYGPDDAHR